MKDSDQSGHFALKSRQRPRVSSRSWLTGAVFAALIFWYFDVHDLFDAREYALCSESNNIYTVDESNPRVECLVVRGSRISDMGTQGNIIKIYW